MTMVSGLSAQQMMHSNQVDAVFSVDDSFWLIHNEPKGTGVSRLLFKENGTFSTHQTIFYEGMNLMPKSWPRVETSVSLRLGVLELKNEFVIPKKNSLGEWNGFYLFEKGKSLKNSLKDSVTLSTSIGVFNSPFQYNIESDTVWFYVGVSGKFGILLDEGDWKKSSGDLEHLVYREWDASEGDFNPLLDAVCNNSSECRMNDDFKLWSESGEYLASSEGVWKKQGSGYVQKLDPEIEFYTLFNGSQYLEAADSETDKSSIQYKVPNSNRWIDVISSYWDSENPWQKAVEKTISSFAMWDETLWVAGMSLDGQSKGLLKIESGELMIPVDEKAFQVKDLFYYIDQGLVPDTREISGVAILEKSNTKILLASTLGFGVAYTVDNGENWKALLNRTEVAGGLKEVRIIPSIMTQKDEKIQIAYKLTRDSKIHIEVYNYNMEKVRDIQKNAWRLKDPIRSNDPRLDVWDGKDNDGKAASPGPYYILVKDNRDHKVWSKCLKLSGPVQ
tara:strand:- start:4790 stop:6298 length:1509 start_codon:yes stop_codon:yes gene_type:complete